MRLEDLTPQEIQYLKTTTIKGVREKIDRLVIDWFFEAAIIKIDLGENLRLWHMAVKSIYLVKY